MNKRLRKWIYDIMGLLIIAIFIINAALTYAAYQKMKFAVSFMVMHDENTD